MISTRLVHVHAESSPGAGFEPAPPILEDVYFDSLTPAKA